MIHNLDWEIRKEDAKGNAQDQREYQNTFCDMECESVGQFYLLDDGTNGAFCGKLTKPSRSIQIEDHFNGQPIVTGNCTRWILGFMELFSALTLNLF